MPGHVSGFALAYTAGGAVVMWSGIRGETISATFRGLLAGKAPAADQEPISGSTPAGTGSTGGTAPPGDTGAGTAQAAANQAVARLLAAPYGWSAGTQWEDLVSLWNRESGWDQYAQNPSGAYGIPQALPPTKMPYAAQAGGGSSVTVQIQWGLGYIKTTYGSPSAAWAHETSDGWY